MTIDHKDKVFAQNWIEQMRREFEMYAFSKYTGEPLTYVFYYRPDTYVNCFWWGGGAGGAWNRRDEELPFSNLVR